MVSHVLRHKRITHYALLNQSPPTSRHPICGRMEFASFFGNSNVTEQSRLSFFIPLRALGKVIWMSAADDNDNSSSTQAQTGRHQCVICLGIVACWHITMRPDRQRALRSSCTTHTHIHTYMQDSMLNCVLFHNKCLKSHSMSGNVKNKTSAMEYLWSF